jgi:enterochelin esterase-like enzyme
VIYFLHGLPANPTTYKTNAFVAGALASSGQRAIVVAPQGARKDNSDREYLDWSADENWPRAIAHDLTSCIDQRFHTIENRFGRALIGLSAGGYGAFNIGLRNLQTFAAVEAWSGYFVATDPSGDQVLELGSTQAMDNATVPRGAALVKELATWPSLIAFYVGNQDSRFLTMNQSFDAALTQSDIAHTFQIYAGGHSEALWRAQAPRWLGLTPLSVERRASRRARGGRPCRSPGSRRCHRARASRRQGRRSLIRRQRLNAPRRSTAGAHTRRRGPKGACRRPAAASRIPGAR